MLLGVHTLNLDAKGRMAIPATHRESLVETCASRLVATINPSSTDRCLWLYPENEWLDVAAKLAALPAVDKRAQAYKRLILGHASPQELDAQGRIRVTPELRDYAGLGKKVVISGQVNKFEVWDLEVWGGNRERWIETFESEDEDPSSPLAEITL